MLAITQSTNCCFSKTEPWQSIPATFHRMLRFNRFLFRPRTVFIICMIFVWFFQYTGCVHFPMDGWPSVVVSNYFSKNSRSLLWSRNGHAIFELLGWRHITSVTTSLRRSPAFTGCARLSTYNSSWRCWSSDRCMDWLHSTWPTTLSVSPTCLAGIGSDQRGDIDWRYRECSLRLWATEHSVRPVPDSGTACQATSSIVRLLTCSVVGWNISFSVFLWH